MSDQREDSREESKRQHRLAGLWGMMNSLKREGDSQRAVMAKQYGVNPADLPNFGAEIPFGNVNISQRSNGSSFGKLTQAAVLALAVGAAGFGLHSYMKEPAAETITPPPVNAVIEWEIIPDGESSSGSVSSEALRLREGTSTSSSSEIIGPN